MKGERTRGIKKTRLPTYLKTVDENGISFSNNPSTQHPQQKQSKNTIRDGGMAFYLKKGEA